MLSTGGSVLGKADEKKLYVFGDHLGIDLQDAVRPKVIIRNLKLNSGSFTLALVNMIQPSSK